MDKYIISLDLDDTLLNSNLEITDRAKKVLRKYQDLGNKIVINTARNFSSTKRFIDQINADYICMCNGNIIMDKNLNILYYNEIASDIYAELLKKLTLITDEIIIDNKDYSFCLNEKNKNVINSIVVSNEKLMRSSACKMFVIKNEFNSKAISEVIKDFNIKISCSRDGKRIRILPFKSDKVLALKYIKNLLGNEYKTMVFGDDIIDLKSMLYADVGVCMENSIPIVLDSVKLKTTSNDKEGVALFLEKFLENLKIK